MTARTTPGVTLAAHLRLSTLWERAVASLWFLPAVSVTVSFVVALALSNPGLGSQVHLPGMRFSSSPEGARAILSTVAGSTITVTGLTFSLTVVALQVAASQFTPRLLGTFLSDRGNQAVLSVFLSTFVYSLVVLRSVRDGDGATAAFVPHLAVAVGMVLTLASVAMLVYFFHHLTQQLRVETVMAQVEAQTLAEIHSGLAEADGTRTAELPPVPEHAALVRARRSGYLQRVQLDALLRLATRHDVVVRLRPVVGTHVTAGTTLAWVWSPQRGPDEETDLGEDLTHGLHGGIHLGPERSLRQDVAFGIRQLVDVAAKALSTGMNDPTTTTAAIGALANVLTELVARQLGPCVRVDDEGRIRVAVPRPSFDELLALACDQPRRYGQDEPAVLSALLAMLADVAEVVGEARDPGHVGAVRRQVEATLERIEHADLDPSERERIRGYARHALTALEDGSRVADVTEDVEQPAE